MARGFNSSTSMINFLKFLIFASLLVFLIPANLYRFVYFNIIIELAVVVYVWLLVKNKIRLPKITLIGAAFLFFIIASAFAVIFSEDVFKSFWGSPLRALSGGFFAYIHYFLFFVIATTVFFEKENYLKLFKFFISIGAIIEFYGIIERFYLDKLRVDSFFGNPIYFGSFSLFVLFISLYFFILENKKWFKFIYGAVVFLGIYGVYLSLSRGPILGLGVSLVLFSPAFLYLAVKKIQNYYPKINTKIAVMSIGLIFVILAGVLFPILKHNDALKRFANISQDSSVVNRLATWDIAIKAIGDKPILGWGQDNFELAFSKYFNPKFITDNVSELWFDRAHNNIFDIAVTIGIVGLFAYLTIWIAVLLALIHLYRHGHKIESIVFSMFFVAYFVSNLTFFDTLGTFLSFTIILGFLSQRVMGKRELGLSDKSEKSLQKLLFKNDNKRILQGFVMLLLIVCIFANFQIAKASHYYYNIKFDGNKKFDDLAMLYDNIVSVRPTVFEAEATYSFARIVMGVNINDEKLNDYLDLARKKLEKLSNRSLLDIKPLYYRARIDMLDFELTSNINSLYSAENLLKKAIVIAPSRQDLYMDLAQVYMGFNDSNASINYLKMASELNPNFSRPHFYLSVLYLFNARNDLAEKELSIIENSNIYYNYSDIGNLLYLADHFIERGEYKKAIDFLEKIVRLDWNDIEARKRLVMLYGEIGEVEKSKEQIWIISTLKK